MEALQYHDVTILPTSGLRHVDRVVFLRVYGDEVAVHLLAIYHHLVVDHRTDKFCVRSTRAEHAVVYLVARFRVMVSGSITLHLFPRVRRIVGQHVGLDDRSQQKFLQTAQRTLAAGWVAHTQDDVVQTATDGLVRIELVVTKRHASPHHGCRRKEQERPQATRVRQAHLAQAGILREQFLYLVTPLVEG